MKFSRIWFKETQATFFGLSSIVLYSIVAFGCSSQRPQTALLSTENSRFQLEVAQADSVAQKFKNIGDSNLSLEKLYVNFEEIILNVDGVDFPIQIQQSHFDALNPNSELKGALLGNITTKGGKSVRIHGKLGSSGAAIFNGEHRSVSISDQKFDLTIENRALLPGSDELLVIKLKFDASSLVEVESDNVIQLVPAISFDLGEPQIDATRINPRVVAKRKTVGEGKDSRVVEVRGDGSWIIEGDIAVGSEGIGLNDRFKSTDPVYEGIRRIDKVRWAWTGGIVPYAFDSSVNSSQQAQLVTAMSHGHLWCLSCNLDRVLQSRTTFVL